jgi:hypothetical protein
MLDILIFTNKISLKTSVEKLKIPCTAKKFKYGALEDKNVCQIRSLSITFLMLLICQKILENATTERLLELSRLQTELAEQERYANERS